MNINEILIKCEAVLASCLNAEQLQTAITYVSNADKFVINNADRFVINNGHVQVINLPSVVFKAKMIELTRIYGES